MLASCQHGFGRHIRYLAPADKEQALMYFFLTQITYKASLNLTKCSILLLFLRVFGAVRWFRILTYAMLAIVACYCIASVTATVFQCIPIQRAFNKTVPGSCISLTSFWYANGAFNIATDFIILTMPMGLVYGLQIGRTQKLSLIVVFALGGFVVVTSCLRMTTISFASTTPDTTYDIASTMWTMIEMNVAVVCACMPMLRPVVVKLLPGLFPSTSAGRTPHGGGGYESGSGPSHQRSKVQVSRHSQSTPEPEWGQVETEGESKEFATGGDGDDGWAGKDSPRIQKTVRYSVEYSSKGKLRGPV